jgi:hypothetical protein
VILVIGLRKTENKDPQEFKLKFKDSENKDKAAVTTKYGSEPQLRTLLKNGGMSNPEIAHLFEDAKAHS